ncbi:hypothetical protein CALVIDRAFT_411878 [Calocera viscosa TUFC12733]|uniref:Uncharacterized protein n=1 Tax=Calocera viscosa (strain TUFC12733) TaxID=1330018 RepID=A0A167G4U9_CALVF|nr:hypothetical protein CALVIDRAFT_411878 [Calocera viscosa TUFC12733]
MRQSSHPMQRSRSMTPAELSLKPRGDDAALEQPPVMHSASAAPKESMIRIPRTFNRHPAAVEAPRDIVITGVARSKPSMSKLELTALLPPLMVITTVMPKASSEPENTRKPAVACHIEVSLAVLLPQKAKGMLLIAQEIEDAIGAVEYGELDVALEAGSDGLAASKRFKQVFYS